MSCLWLAGPMWQKGGEQVRIETLFIPSVDCQTLLPVDLQRALMSSDSTEAPSSSWMSGQTLHPILPETRACRWIPYAWCTEHMMQR